MDFTSPNNSPEFVAYWDILVEGIRDRENLRKVHLHQLKILCNLYIEYDALCELVQEQGYVTQVESRYGIKEIIRPEVEIRKNVLSQIIHYSKLLGIVLVKETKADDPVSEWV